MKHDRTEERSALDALVQSRLSRRTAVKSLLAGGAAAAASGVVPMRLLSDAALAAAGDPSTLTFTQCSHVIKEDHHVAPGYESQVLMRWGDKVLPDAPEWDPKNLSGDAQEKQFGYNADFVAFMPLPAGSNNSDHGLLCVSHEYTDAELMYSGMSKKTKVQDMTKEQTDVDISAHGHSVVEIKKDGNKWA
ncbi:MAG: DUF839 domain-containing protein, partial [Rhodospirillales bacterium]|nr:DUF839 domain-containing protein [Rhodospirillales bacterium]